MSQEESQQSATPRTAASDAAPPAGPAVTPVPPVEPTPRAAAKPDRPPYALAGSFAAVMMIVYFALPAIYQAHYEFLFWAEGFMERAFGTAFLTGSLQKVIETPKPLWSLFWLLGRTPNQLLILLGLMTGGIFFLFPLVSWKLSRSAVPGIVGSLLMVFGFKDVLSLMVQGSWVVPYLLLGVLFVLALYARRFAWAALAVGLIGLLRPEGWFLAVFMLLHIAPQRGRLKWYHFLPLLTPLLWMYYDHRISGDWMYTSKATAAYAVLTGLTVTNFANFWRVLLPDVISSTGVLILLYALVGIVLRARNISREARGGKTRAVLLDPLLATALVPLAGCWLLSMPGNTVIMGRFVLLSTGLLTLYALLLPYELFKNRRIANRNVVIGAIWAPLVLVGLVRSPEVGRDVHRELKVSESKMAAIEGLCEEVKKPVTGLDQYRFIFIPLRRYAVFENFLPGDISHKLISYREVSLATISTQMVISESLIPEPPKGSPEFLKRLMSGEYHFADFLPALALWVPDDEAHYIDAFAFDEPDYFRRNYIDHSRYGFRIIGEALDSLGLIYDCRDLQPEEIRMLPPAKDTLAPEGGDSVENAR